MVQAGIVTREPVKDRKEWTVYEMIEKLNKGLMKGALGSGTSSWDVVVQRALIICLLPYIGTGAGDVPTAADYDGFQHLTWGDVEIFMPGPTSFRAEVTLRYQKDDK